MTVNAEKVIKHLNSRSKEQDGHTIWTGPVTLEGLPAAFCLPANCYDDAKNLTVRPIIYKSPWVWLDQARRNAFVPTGLKKSVYRRTCSLIRCISHYQQESVNIKSYTAMTDTDVDAAKKRFSENCGPKDSKTGCISWTGKKDKDGYGVFTIWGKSRRAHRVCWQLNHRKDIEHGLLIRHLCPQSNHACVAIEHLTPGTPKENAGDEKHRRKVGEDLYNASTTEDVVKKIIDSRGNGKTQEARSKEFGVSVPVIKRIDTAKCWIILMM
jgi:hypothetical protein